MLDWIPLPEWRRLPVVSGLYVIRHRESGKEYVGKSVDVRLRAQRHLITKKAQVLHLALAKYGAAAFDIAVFATGDNAAMLALEIETIAARGSLAPGGYNITAGGEGALGRKHTPESLAKIRASTIKRNTGAIFTDERRANMSKALKGRAAPVMSTEAKEKIGAAQRKPNPKKSNSGPKNGMFGVKGAGHPAASVILAWPRESYVPLRFETVLEAAAFYQRHSTSVCDWLAGRTRHRDGVLFCYA